MRQDVVKKTKVTSVSRCGHAPAQSGGGPHQANDVRSFEPLRDVTPGQVQVATSRMGRQDFVDQLLYRDIR